MTDSAGVALVFGVGEAGTDLPTAVNESITVLSRPIAVHLATVGALPTGLQLALATDVPSVSPGQQACFDVTLIGSGTPQGSFALEFSDPAAARTLGSIPVTVACTCGDGFVDAANGEQCDEGAANGMPGSCCDAACQIVAAGTTCRAAPAACQSAGVCDGGSAVCPQSVALSDGTLCDDGDPTTGTSALGRQRLHGHVRGARVARLALGHLAREEGEGR